jgi:hypothetical protein
MCPCTLLVLRVTEHHRAWRSMVSVVKGLTGYHAGNYLHEIQVHHPICRSSPKVSLEFSSDRIPISSTIWVRSMLPNEIENSTPSCRSANGRGKVSDSVRPVTILASIIGKHGALDGWSCGAKWFPTVGSVIANPRLLTTFNFWWPMYCICVSLFPCFGDTLSGWL